MKDVKQSFLGRFILLYKNNNLDYFKKNVTLVNVQKF